MLSIASMAAPFVDAPPPTGRHVLHGNASLARHPEILPTLP